MTVNYQYCQTQAKLSIYTALLELHMLHQAFLTFNVVESSVSLEVTSLDQNQAKESAEKDAMHK